MGVPFRLDEGGVKKGLGVRGVGVVFPRLGGLALLVPGGLQVEWWFAEPDYFGASGRHCGVVE